MKCKKMKRVPHGYIRPINYARLVETKGRLKSIVYDMNVNLTLSHSSIIFDLHHFVALGTKNIFFPSFLNISIRAIFVIIFLVFILPGVGVFFRMSGLFRLLCLHIFTYKHVLVYYLLIAEICIYLDERWTSISFSLTSVIYCSREILKPIQRRCYHINTLLLAKEISTISTYYLVVFLEIKNQDICSSNHL
uniref:Transmembrane protein n=1 Tax=Heterorhabditis bacteriophora TaxID=37862 RepID=A0A1I7WG62_HETBA